MTSTIGSDDEEGDELMTATPVRRGVFQGRKNIKTETGKAGKALQVGIQLNSFNLKDNTSLYVVEIKRDER